MSELQSSADVDLGFYTIFCWVQCCCIGGVLGFFLCLYCKSRIEHYCMSNNMTLVEKWQKRFWICFFLDIIISAIILVCGLGVQIFTAVTSAMSI